MPTQTPNYSFDVPVIGADKDTWGGFLNGNWTDIDTLLKGVDDDAAAAAAAAAAAQATANGALQRSGGTMTGQITLPGNATGSQAASMIDAAGLADTGDQIVQGNLDAHIADDTNPHAVTAAQTGSLPLAGGAISGALSVAGALTANGSVTLGKEVLIADQELVSSANIVLNMAGPSRKLLTLDHNAIITVSGGVPNQSVELIIAQGTTGGDVTFAGVAGWIGGVAPVLTDEVGQADLIVFLTVRQGNTVYGHHIGSTAVPS